MFWTNIKEALTVCGIVTTVALGVAFAVRYNQSSSSSSSTTSTVNTQQSMSSNNGQPSNPDNVHVTLLGDSIFDNEVYVKGYNESVTGQLEENLRAINSNWKVTNCAVDGAVASSIDSQIPTIPKNTTHIFVSVIGNDCLGALSQLHMSQQWQSIAAAPSLDNPVLANILGQLSTKYDAALGKVTKLGVPVVAVNLYAPRFDERVVQQFCSSAVHLVNAQTSAVAQKHGVHVIDICSLFTDYNDYANAIEPGAPGSRKIAKAIADVLLKMVRK